MNTVPGRPPILADIAVVIPTLGRQILEQSLAAVRSGTTWPAQLVVVDQSSSPAVKTMVEKLRADGFPGEYVPSTARGRSAGVNRGVRQVRTRYLTVTDDDCFVAPDWLERIHTRLLAHEGCAITGRVDPDGDGTAVATITRTAPAVYGRPRLTFDPFCGGNMGIERDLIHSVGPFDEDPHLRSAEDCEWAYRALRAGVRIVYAPEVVVRHYGWRDGAARAERYRAFARSHGGFYGKYLRRADHFIAVRMFLHLLRAGVRWTRGIVTGDAERRAEGRAYLFGLLPGAIAAVRRGSRAPGGEA